MTGTGAMATDGREVYLAPEIRATPLSRLLAPFFPKYRVLGALGAEPEPLRHVYRNLVLSHDRRLLFVKNHKAACTSTAQILHHWAHGTFYKGNIHRAQHAAIRIGRYHWPEIAPVLRARSAFLFTFVRHPEKRVLSAFRNFFEDGRNRALHKHVGPMRAHGFDPGQSRERNLDAFLDYIGHSLALDRAHTDTHWRPQVDTIGFGRMDYDLIGRMETYGEDLVKAFRAAGIADYPGREVLEHRFNPSKGKGSEVVLSAAQRRRIEEMYADDYAAFGY
ncbi:MAG: sulfotransferase family protein [Rhodobacteraceae bacterium]|nr:sulfotransferase family protein [Paracoccaceae bacterium]